MIVIVQCYRTDDIVSMHYANTAEKHRSYEIHMSMNAVDVNKTLSSEG